MILQREFKADMSEYVSNIFLSGSIEKWVAENAFRAGYQAALARLEVTMETEKDDSLAEMAEACKAEEA
jgi:hypothetical protein